MGIGMPRNKSSKERMVFSKSDGDGGGCGQWSQELAIEKQKAALAEKAVRIKCFEKHWHEKLSG